MKWDFMWLEVVDCGRINVIQILFHSEGAMKCYLVNTSIQLIPKVEL